MRGPSSSRLQALRRHPGRTEQRRPPCLLCPCGERESARLILKVRSGAAAARRAHNPKVLGSNPSSATILIPSPLSHSCTSGQQPRYEQEKACSDRQAPEEEAEAEGADAGRSLSSLSTTVP